jgi:hypothetical protein
LAQKFPRFQTLLVQAREALLLRPARCADSTRHSCMRSTWLGVLEKAEGMCNLQPRRRRGKHLRWEHLPCSAIGPEGILLVPPVSSAQEFLTRLFMLSLGLLCTARPAWLLPEAFWLLFWELFHLAALSTVVVFPRRFLNQGPLVMHLTKYHPDTHSAKDQRNQCMPDTCDVCELRKNFPVPVAVGRSYGLWQEC